MSDERSPEMVKSLEGKRRGVKAGGHNPGAFKKGHDPRRLKDPVKYKANHKKTFQKKIREMEPDALLALDRIINDKEAPNREVMDCAALILSYSQGRPVDRIAIQQLGDGGGGNTDAMNFEQLKQAASNYLLSNEAPIEHEEGELIEHES